MARSSTNCVQLNWINRDGNITVTPVDEDRFTIKVGRAIELLNLAKQQESFQNQLQLLLRILADWLSERDGVRQAHVTIRDGALTFVVVRATAEYDEAFEDALSELDISIANDVDLNLVKMNALCLPDASDASIATFLDPSFLLTYNDEQGAEPRRTGEQEPSDTGTTSVASH